MKEKIVVTNLCKSFNDIAILQNINLKVVDGDSIAIVVLPCGGNAGL